MKVDPATWRFLRLRAEDRWPDGTLDVFEVETLQPAEWVEQHRAKPGANVPLPLDLLEMGVREDLPATVVANDPCPPIVSGPGAVVLTTVNHLNPNVFELALSDDHGKCETVRPTGLHKFYSGDRRCWLNTQDLKEGERLRSIDGWLTVSSLRRLPGVQRVYNMTVAGEHVYHVSSLGLLSHNVVGCGGQGGGVGFRVMSQEEFAGASQGQWADGAWVQGDLNEMGSKWLWTDEGAAQSWQEYVARNGDETIIAHVPTDQPLSAYEPFEHPPQGTAIHVPIGELGPAQGM